MIAAYFSAMRRYVDFGGRASRGQFWWFHLALNILLFAAMGIDAAVSEDPESSGASLAGLVLLAHLLPALSLAVRRLQDADRSGWFALVGLVPVVGPILLIVWFCQPGTPGPNRFGVDPLSRFDDASVRSGRPLAAAARDVVGEIERLAGLRASGTLSVVEFETLKAQVVAGSARA